MNIPVYIGFDARETDAYRVCVASMTANSTVRSLSIVPICRQSLGELYTRPTSRGESGVLWDDISEQPMSTDFSIARFFIPLVQTSGWALFCDCDFLWRGDVGELFACVDDRYAVMVVKHAHEPTTKRKMDGQHQTAYRRKNWSSLMLLNCSAPEVRALSRDALNSMTKWDLHSFSWVGDERIGELAQTWNWLAGVNPPIPEPGPKVVHHTLGIPTMAGYENSPYADEWRMYACR